MNYEQKFIEIPFGAKDSELKGWEYTIPEGMEAIVKDGKIIVKEKESEDERIRLMALVKNCYENGGYALPTDEYKSLTAWLEKQKEQKQYDDDPLNDPRFLDGFDVGREVQKIFDEPEPAEWSEEDEKIKHDIENLIHFALRDGSAVSPAADTTKEDALNWLKSLRPQPKQEWSEEDEIDLDDAIKYVQNYGETSSDEYARLRTKEIVEWLKSLPHRFSLSSWGEEIRDAFFGVESNWKPSEEQMGALHTVCYVPELEVYGGLTDWLKELYEQLKAL